MKTLLGTWQGPDEYISEVEYTVSENNGKISVAAIDPSDGEIAKVNEIEIVDDQLRFVATWQSSGRVCSCRMEALPNGEAELTFTFTDHARLVRKLRT